MPALQSVIQHCPLQSRSTQSDALQGVELGCLPVSLVLGVMALAFQELEDSFSPEPHLQDIW